MKIVIQRVKQADVKIEQKIVGKIEKGYLILLGIGKEDTEDMLQKYVDKIVKMRIFADENGKTNLSLKDVNGQVLVVSQFTLYADCKKGNRPNFLLAGEPEKAKNLYEKFVELMKEQVDIVQTGEFGADMDVSLINDGPFTVVLENL